MSAMMRAVVIREYGGPDSLQLTEVPRPVPKAGETLVRIRAAAVNPADGKWRAGMFESFAPIGFPHILGYDIAADVEAGEGFAPGARVFGMLDSMTKGAYAEYVAVSIDHLAIIPKELDFTTAAAIPTAGLTGAQMVSDLDLGRDSFVLITGALGSVGRFALYAAKQRGAHVVAAVRAERRAEALEVGADDAVALDGQQWQGAQFDHVLDTVGGEAVGRLCRSLRPGGRILTAATTPIVEPDLKVQPEFFTVRPDGAQTRQLGKAVAAGEITVPIAKVLPLHEAAEAQRITDAGGTGGKVILTP